MAETICEPDPSASKPRWIFLVAGLSPMVIVGRASPLLALLLTALALVAYAILAWRARSPVLTPRARTVLRLRRPRDGDRAFLGRLFMKPARRIGFILAITLMVISFAGAPAIAQQDAATALDRKVQELYGAGKFSEAIPLARRVLAIREKALGPYHPDVATSLNNLATLYQGQGRYADAEPLYKRSLAIREEAFDPDHPDVAQSLNNLAALYQAQGRYADAE